MKKLKIIPILLFAAFTISNVQAQYIKVDNGFIDSKFRNKENLPILSDNVRNYAFLLGIDYLDKKRFYLSSQIGYVKLGGEEFNEFLQEPNRSITEEAEYIHLNTTFKFRLNLDERLFVSTGAGPYINILLGEEEFNNLNEGIYQYENLFVGGRLEGGLTYDVKKIRIGITYSYLYDLSAIAKSGAISLYNDNHSVMLTTGYRIR
jgi:hypothetical protein